MDIKIIAGSLLLFRLMAAFLIWLVLRKQWVLLRADADTGVKRTRQLMFYLAVVIFAGQFIPIAIDALTLIDGRNQEPTALEISYAYSNAFTAMTASLLLWLIYFFIERQRVELMQKDVEIREGKDDLLASETELKQSGEDLKTSDKKLKASEKRANK